MTEKSPFENFSLGVEEKEKEEQREIETEEMQEVAILPEKEEDNYLVREVSRYRELTEEQKLTLSNYMMMQSHGINICITPIICKDSCPFQNLCPLFAMGEHPSSKPCPVESAIMKKYRDQLAAGLGINMDDGNFDIFDMKLIDDLAMIQMLKRRALAELAEEPATAEKNIAGFLTVPGSPAEPFFKTVSNPRIGTIQNLIKLETKLMTELLATRRSKFQAEGNASDPSIRAAELLRKMKEMKAVERNREEIVDADYEVKDES